MSQKYYLLDWFYSKEKSCLETGNQKKPTKRERKRERKDYVKWHSRPCYFRACHVSQVPTGYYPTTPWCCVLRTSRFAFICCCCRLWLQEQRFFDRGFLINFLIRIRALAVSNDFLLQDLVFLSCRSGFFLLVPLFFLFFFVRWGGVVDWLCEYRSVRVGRRCFVSVFFFFFFFWGFFFFFSHILVFLARWFVDLFIFGFTFH